MNKKEKAFEYAKMRYGNNGKETQNEMAKMIACRVGYEAGWDEVLKSILVDASQELPEYDNAVWVINENKEQFFCHRSNEGIVKTDKYGWCNYTGCNIVAWIRNITFDEILELNKDVLKRLKENKGYAKHVN